jgi:hypothetical protein
VCVCVCVAYPAARPVLLEDQISMIYVLLLFSLSCGAAASLLTLPPSSQFHRESNAQKEESRTRSPLRSLLLFRGGG